ncbi:MAG: polysaccharide lyase [Verrucomicrobia bacterium]|nr:polysaccharide lyase [Verrucomicrobiota bacterium]
MDRTFRTGFALILCSLTVAAAGPSPAEVKAALVKAVGFYHAKASIHGGYVYRYSGDFSLREAEGIPGPDTIWIQPPGTPAIGAAFLDVYEVTRTPACLAAAVDAAHALTRTQMASGGWDYAGHFDAGSREKRFYRRDPAGNLLERSAAPGGEAGWHVWRRREHHETNYTTLDDDVTQSALRLLMRVDQALGFGDAEIHEAVLYGLKAICQAQYPCGAWSAAFETYPRTPPDPALYPVKQASAPDSWSRTWTKDFTGCYVTNDNLHATMIRTLLLAGQIYKDTVSLDAARRAGEFLIRAQMPEPQPGWAQQYDERMQPVWSRAFEPPAVSGRESQAMMWALLTVCAATGDKKFLGPLPAALAYFRKSLLPDGRLARFYELGTNKPLYFKRGPGGKGHELTYEDDNTASNYGWKWASELDAIEATGKRLSAGGVAPGLYTLPPVSRPTDAEVERILDGLDADGAWVEREGERGIMRNAEGKKTQPARGVIHGDGFVANATSLCIWVRGR